LRFLYDRYIGQDPKRLAELEEARADMDVAQLIYDLRTNAGLSQRELARRIGTSASAICRLESADYQGHSLAVLRRIAAVLNHRVEIRLAPIKPKQKRVKTSSR